MIKLMYLKLNIPFKMKLAIIKTLDNIHTNEADLMTLYDEVEIHVKSLLVSGSMSRFLQSKVFARALGKQGWKAKQEIEEDELNKN